MELVERDELPHGHRGAVALQQRGPTGWRGSGGGSAAEARDGDAVAREAAGTDGRRWRGREQPRRRRHVWGMASWRGGAAEVSMPERHTCQTGMQSTNFLLIIAYVDLYILISQVVNSLLFFFEGKNISFLVEEINIVKRSFLRSTDAFNDHSSRYTDGFMLSDYFPFSPFDTYYLLLKLLKCMCVPKQ